MKKLRFLSIGLLVAFLTGVVALSSCKKDNDPAVNPAAEGRKAAQEYCACFKLEDEDAVENCLENVYEKFEKLADDDDDAFWEPFEDAFEAELEKCDVEIDW